MRARPDRPAARGFAATRRARLILLAACVTAGLLSLAARCAWLQVVKAPDLLDLARSQQERAITLDPPRGQILDRQGKELAVSVDVDSLFADPGEIGDAAAAARRLAPLLDVPAAELRQRLTGDRSFVWLKRKITPDLRRRVESLRLRGLGFARESRRFYPKRALAAHIVGACGVDNQGLGGLEFAFDETIRGVPGRLLALRDGRGGRVLDRARQDPKPGIGLVLTIDEVVQHVAERELDAAMAQGAAGAAVVLLRPATGEVLALASRPTFDPNRYAAAKEEARRNRAVSDYYEPGSAFKMVTAAAALDAGRVHPNEVIWCENGSIVVARHRIDEDRLPFGNLTFTEVLAKSSNVGAIKVARRLRPAEFLDAIRGFGFGRRTGIELPGESAGMLRDVDDWSGLSQASLAMGQEIGATTLQLAAMTAAIADDGMWRRPRVVLETIGADGSRAPRPAQPTDAHRAIEPSTARALRRMLQSVATDEGTGKAAALPGYSVGGKTGTAQKIDASGRYSRGRHVAWFAGFAPADRPAIAMVVMVDEPRGPRFHGGDVAAPVFARIALPVLEYLGVPPDRKGTLVFDRAAGALAARDGDAAPGAAVAAVRRAPDRRRGARRAAPAINAASLIAAGPPARAGSPPPRGGTTMPDVAGMSLRRATETLATAGVVCRHSGTGPRAVRQTPEAGAPVGTGTACAVGY